MNKFFSLVLAGLILTISSCMQRGGEEDERLIIFHAGSLSVPFKEMTESFRAKHPGLDIRVEIAGSVACARKITDLNKPCDIMASADYRVIEEMLIPEHAQWNIPFAANEMVIAWESETTALDADSWYKVLAGEEVRYGRSDPDADPCGYRTLQLLKLAERHYAEEGLAAQLAAKDERYIRPKEVDLLALLESGSIDYMFIYRSVAEQHGLEYLSLPEEINLAEPSLDDWYGQVSVEIRGNQPGEKISLPAAAMVYGITQLTDAPNPEMATAFLQFVLGPEGQAIMQRNGQQSLIPAETPRYEHIPEALREYALQPK